MSRVLTRLRWSAYAFFKSRGEAALPFRPLEDVLSRQNRKVRSMVRHAWATVPHYREVMSQAGLKPSDVRTADDLERLPMISGAELAAAPQRFYSSEYGPANTLALASSGTNGAPKIVRYNFAALFESLAHGQRQRAVMARFTSRNAGYREMSISREESISKQLRAFYEAHSWVPGGLDVRRRRLSLELPFSELIDGINEFKPDVLTGYGSHLGALLRYAKERRPDFHRPQLIWYGAEAMSRADRMLIEREAGIPVLSTYQADEALRIGFQCERRQGFHLSLDDVAVRVIRPDGQPAGAGESGEIVISNLNNRATVLLNYRLGDIVTLPAEPCSCGRSLPTLEAISGRANDMLRMSDGEQRHALLFLAPLQTIPGVSQVQLLQRADGSVRVNTVCAAGSDWSEISESVGRIMRELLGRDIDVEARQIAEIPREPSGKVRAVISHWGE